MKTYTLSTDKWNENQRTRLFAADKPLNHRMKGMTTLVRLAVCESEREIIDCIINTLRDFFPSECNIMTYSDGVGLLSEHLRERFDAIFLGITIPGFNGLKIAEKIRENDRCVKIIFVSGQNELAYKGYLYGAFRFVRKSNLVQDLREAAISLNQALCFQNESFVFKTDNEYVAIAAKDIKFFEADGHFLNIVCTDGAIRTHGTLQDYEERMKNIGFIRIHKGYLVNFRYISSTDNKTVTLSCGTRLPLSRNRINNAKAKIRFFQEL